MISGIKRSEWMYAFVGPACLLAAVIALADDPAATGQAAATTAAADLYAVPEGATEEQLGQQLQQLLQTPPAESTPEGLKTHIAGIRRFVIALQDPERPLGDDLVQRAYQVEYELLVTLIDRLGDTGSETELTSLRTRLADDERAGAQRATTYIQINELDEMSVEDRTVFIERIAQQLTGVNGEIDNNALTFAEMSGEVMEFVAAPDEAIAVYELFVKYLSASTDPRAPEMAEYFQGKAAFLGLIGQELSFTSTTLDGHPFDLASYTDQNKVVLVDFWATWCGPCIAELPNVKAHYDAYHDMGFEVVGISLDDDVDSLKQFVADQQIEWPTLIESDPMNQGWVNPIAAQYGITALPTCILLDQEGKVVSLDARGAELSRLLEELLGPPPAPAAPAAP